MPVNRINKCSQKVHGDRHQCGQLKAESQYFDMLPIW